MSFFRSALALTALSLVGCAGSVGFDHCEPAVCAADCDLDEDCFSVFDLTILTSPGTSLDLRAFVDIQGAYAGNWDFSADADAPLTTTVDPDNADVDGSGLFPIDVAITVPGETEPGDYSVSIVAQRDDLLASTLVLFEIPEP
jgi:hypothetical protein